jgi:MFS family permease
MKQTPAPLDPIADQPAVRPLPWYQTVTREQWKALAAAYLGWMLDAMDFVLYLMAITTLQREFGYGTDTSGLLATVALLASAAGALLFGLVADRFGRTKALMATVLIFSFCSLGTATAQDLGQLIVWRALLGLGIGGEWASGAVLVNETWPAEHRNKATAIMQSGWAIGYILAAVIAAIVLPVLGWRWLFVVGGLPAFLVLWVRREVQEPEVWKHQQGRTADGNPLRAILGRALIGRTVLATLLMGSVLFAYWGTFSWLPAFLASPVESGGAGMSIVNSMAWIVSIQLGAFLGYLSFGFIADYLGRRRTFVLFLLAAAGLVPLYGHMAGWPLGLMILGPFLGFFGHGHFSVFGVLLAELFPTAARATGQGFAYSGGRALSALAPYTVGALAQTQGIGPALALTSIFFLTGAGLILLVPRGAAPSPPALEDSPAENED